MSQKAAKAQEPSMEEILPPSAASSPTRTASSRRRSPSARPPPRLLPRRCPRFPAAKPPPPSAKNRTCWSWTDMVEDGKASRLTSRRKPRTSSSADEERRAGARAVRFRAAGPGCLPHPTRRAIAPARVRSEAAPGPLARFANNPCFAEARARLETLLREMLKADAEDLARGTICRAS